MIRLETYKGTKSRHTCPACNFRLCFVRYVKENGEYLGADVGRCNRESKCGYHRKPKEYFADNPALTKPKKRGATNYGFTDQSKSKNHSANLPNKPDFIPFESFKATLTGYASNNFVNFLLNLFPDCIAEIQDILKMYFVGSFENYTCFPSIDCSNRICRAKLIRFDQCTGKRLKGQFDTSSLPAKLKLKQDFRYKQIFFGTHLLSKYPDKPVGVVEAEKTAIIASLCFPEFVWLGCNSKTWLKAERLKRLGKRQIILYPDADGFDLWQSVAQDAARRGAMVKVSNLIETRATAEQKANGYDLADYLIASQIKINETNNYIDCYNEKLEKVLSDESLFKQFNTILDERIAVCEIDGASSRADAETLATAPDLIREIILSL